MRNWTQIPRIENKAGPFDCCITGALGEGLSVVIGSKEVIIFYKDGRFNKVSRQENVNFYREIIFGNGVFVFIASEGGICF